MKTMNDLDAVESKLMIDAAQDALAATFRGRGVEVPVYVLIVAGGGLGTHYSSNTSNPHTMPQKLRDLADSLEVAMHRQRVNKKE